MLPLRYPAQVQASLLRVIEERRPLDASGQPLHAPYKLPTHCPDCGSAIGREEGEVVARCLTKDDEMAIARCDLDFCAVYKRTTFNFDLHRQPHAYGLITERKGETLAADGTLQPAPTSS